MAEQKYCSNKLVIVDEDESCSSSRSSKITEAELVVGYCVWQKNYLLYVQSLEIN